MMLWQELLSLRVTVLYSSEICEVHTEISLDLVGNSLNGE
jgi:hypothetical protein